MNHTLFLIAGYGITWLTIVGYLLRLGRRERSVGEPSEAIGGTSSPPE